MASPTMRRGAHPFHRSAANRLRLPLVGRRFAAWVVEGTLLVASAAVPFGLGAEVNARFVGEAVPLNPVLATVQETTARTLALPLAERDRRVAPLTNLLWTGALVTPLLVAGFNLYLLSRTGRTLPKRWFGVRVATPTGAPPGVLRILLRETVGRWGIPLTVAYTLWRYTGAFPDLEILAGLAGLLVMIESGVAQLNGRRRSFHDRLAGTFVIETVPRFHGTSRSPSPLSFRDRASRMAAWTEEDAAIAAIVLTPDEPIGPAQGLWPWMRQHPGATLLIVSLSSLGLVLATFVGTQVYIQSQANQREFKQQDNEVFLALVSKLTPAPNGEVGDRQGAILALGTVNDPRALPLLADLLSQADTPQLIDAVQQALVSKGPAALPYLRRLNQALANDLDSLRQGGSGQEQRLTALRQRATQRAIAKILTIFSGQAQGVDLSRINLGQMTGLPAPFTLVLDQADLSGAQLKGALLAGSSLKGVRFYGTGSDRHWGTFDDAIADLSGADLKAADLTNAFLSNVSLTRTSLIRATLTKANASKARLTGANLSSARAVETNFQQADLSRASLTGADLGSANLNQANLQAARLGKVSAIGAQFFQANLTESDWQGADLSGATLVQANLQNANLAATRLVGANLTNAQLQNANLRDADLSMATLQGANLDGADFQGVTFVPLVQESPDQFIKLAPTSPLATTLQGVNFSKVKNLNSEQITYICSQGGLHPKCP